MSTRSHIDTLERELVERAAKLEALKALETAEATLAQTQGELSATQQRIAAARTAIQSEEATLAEKRRAITDAQAILAEVNNEIEAKRRESRALSRVAEQQSKDLRARLHELMPVAPALTEEESDNA
jgi:chromosome segregation ATPase